jgi:hypothetical protein
VINTGVIRLSCPYSLCRFRFSMMRHVSKRYTRKLKRDDDKAGKKSKKKQSPKPGWDVRIVVSVLRMLALFEYSASKLASKLV